MRALIRTGTSKTPTLRTGHPEPSSDESAGLYIIRTRSTALTREELTWPEPLIPEIPVPGYDLAGVVVKVPTSPNPDGQPHALKPGDEVYGVTTFSGAGNARELTVALEKELSLRPRNISWEEAATVPLSALSAYQGLFVHGRLEATFPGYGNQGKRILVTAASGGVGIWGVQLGKQAGAEVIATCGPSNVDFVKSLGADVILDYSKTSLLEWVNADRTAREFDIVLDCIGGQTLSDSWECIKKGGRVIGIAEPPEPKKPTQGVEGGVEGIWFIVEANSTQLAQVTTLIEQNKCKAFVDSVFSLEEWKEAFERLEGGHARGKVVLKIL